MRLLRFLAALVGGTLHRLGQVLRSWAGAAIDGGGEDDRSRDENGPPEHWLRYIRERGGAPWFLASKRSVPTRSAPRRAPVLPSRPEAVVTAAAPRSAPVPALASAPSRAPAQTRPVQHPAPLIRPVAPRLETREIDKRSRDDVRVTPLFATSIVQSPTLERQSSSSKPQPETPPRRFVPVRSIAAPISVEQPARAASATPHSNESLPTPASDPWPSLPPPPPAFRLDAGDAATRPPSVPRDESEAAAGDWRPVMFESASDDETRPAVEPAAQVEADEAGYWADLPEKGLEEWQVQSTRSLLREQLHLARLLAEQAGFSWSTPHS